MEESPKTSNSPFVRDWRIRKISSVPNLSFKADKSSLVTNEDDEGRVVRRRTVISIVGSDSSTHQDHCSPYYRPQSASEVKETACGRISITVKTLAVHQEQHDKQIETDGLLQSTERTNESLSFNSFHIPTAYEDQVQWTSSSSLSPEYDSVPTPIPINHLPKVSDWILKRNKLPSLIEEEVQQQPENDKQQLPHRINPLDLKPVFKVRLNDGQSKLLRLKSHQYTAPISTQENEDLNGSWKNKMTEEKHTSTSPCIQYYHEWIKSPCNSFEQLYPSSTDDEWFNPEDVAQAEDSFSSKSSSKIVVVETVKCPSPPKSILKKKPPRAFPPKSSQSSSTFTADDMSWKLEFHKREAVLRSKLMSLTSNNNRESTALNGTAVECTSKTEPTVIPLTHPEEPTDSPILLSDGSEQSSLSESLVSSPATVIATEESYYIPSQQHSSSSSDEDCEELTYDEPIHQETTLSHQHVEETVETKRVSFNSVLENETEEIYEVTADFGKQDMSESKRVCFSSFIDTEPDVRSVESLDAFTLEKSEVNDGSLNSSTTKVETSTEFEQSALSPTANTENTEEGNGFDNCGVVPADSFTRVEQFPATCKYDDVNEFDDMDSITYILKHETLSTKLIVRENETLNDAVAPMLTPGMSTDKAVQLVRHFFESDIRNNTLNHQRQQQWSSLPVSSHLSVFSTHSSSDEGVESIDTSSDCSPISGHDDLNQSVSDLQPESPKPTVSSLKNERQSRSPHKSRIPIPLRVPRPLSSVPNVRNEPPSKLPTRSRSSHPLQLTKSLQNGNQNDTQHRRRPSLPNAAGLLRASSEADALSSIPPYSSLSPLSLKNNNNKLKNGSWNNQPKKTHAHQFCSNY